MDGRGTARVAAPAAGLALAAALGHRWYALARTIRGRDPSVGLSSGPVDFRDTVWQPVRDLLAGHDPYDVAGTAALHPTHQELDLYAPGELLVHGPLAALPYAVAVVVWSALIGLGLVLLSQLVVRQAGVRLPWRDPRCWGPVAAVASALTLSRSGFNLVNSGQLAIESVLAVWLAVRYRERTWWAAVAVAVALVKPQTGVPLVVLLCALGAAGIALRGVAIAAAASLPVVVALLVVEGGPAPFIRVLAANARHSLTSADTALGNPLDLRVDIAGVLARVHLVVLSGALQLVLFGLVLGTVIAVLRLDTAPGDAPLSHPLAGSLVAAAVLLAAPHQYYELLLLAPVIGTAVGIAVRSSGRARAVAGASAGCLAAALLHGTDFDRLLGPLDPWRRGSALVDLFLILGGLAALTWSLLWPSGVRDLRPVPVPA